MHIPISRLHAGASEQNNDGSKTPLKLELKLSLLRSHLLVQRTHSATGGVCVCVC